MPSKNHLGFFFFFSFLGIDGVGVGGGLELSSHLNSQFHDVYVPMWIHPTGNFLQYLILECLVQDQGVLPALVGGG